MPKDFRAKDKRSQNGEDYFERPQRKTKMENYGPAKGKSGTRRRENENKQEYSTENSAKKARYFEKDIQFYGNSLRNNGNVKAGQSDIVFSRADFGSNQKSQIRMDSEAGDNVKLDFFG